MEVKVNIDSIYLDFQKAFDKADHNVILKKCIEKGLTELLGKWIANYLQDRRQRVIANNQTSVELTVVSGVPQGCVLGPLLSGYKVTYSAKWTTWRGDILGLKGEVGCETNNFQTEATPTKVSKVMATFLNLLLL